MDARKENNNNNNSSSSNNNNNQKENVISFVFSSFWSWVAVTKRRDGRRRATRRNQLVLTELITVLAVDFHPTFVRVTEFLPSFTRRSRVVLGCTGFFFLDSIGFWRWTSRRGQPSAPFIIATITATAVRWTETEATTTTTTTTPPTTTTAQQELGNGIEESLASVASSSLWLLPVVASFLTSLTELYSIEMEALRYLRGFTGLYWVLLSFAGFYWVLLGFTGFYWVLLGFTGFYWVLLFFF